MSISVKKWKSIVGKKIESMSVTREMVELQFDDETIISFEAEKDKIITRTKTK